MTQDHYDILIVGGGLVGASLAKAIAHMPLRIGLVEAKSLQHSDTDFVDPRSIALSYGSSRILTGIGVWQDLQPNCSPILSVHISDQGHFASILLNAADEKVPALGYVIKLPALSQALQNSLSHCSNIELICPAKVTALLEYKVNETSVNNTTTKSENEERTLSQNKVASILADKINNSSGNKTTHYSDDGEEKAWQITLEQAGHTRQIKTSLLIAADGTQSFIRSQLGIATTETDYGQQAILTTITHKEPHLHIAYERFTSSGSIAFLPLSDHQCGLIWATRPDHAQQLLSLSDEDFLAQLQREFGYRLGKLQTINKRHIHPLKMTRAVQQTKKPGFILLGNAAHTLHPIAAQGFNLTLRDVALLAELLSDAHRAGKSIADSSVLSAYEQGIKTDQSHTIAFTQLLTRLFGNNYLPHQTLRDMGLLMLDIIPSPKKYFTRKHMGIAGRQPRLARGLALC